MAQLAMPDLRALRARQAPTRAELPPLEGALGSEPGPCWPGLCRSQVPA